MNRHVGSNTSRELHLLFSGWSEGYIFYEIKNKDMQGETRVNLYGGNNGVYDNGLRKMLPFPQI